jgi:signal transduction histidine kinase/ActR/RegA family two-component response regulator
VEERLPAALCCVAILDGDHGHLRIESSSGKGALSGMFSDQEPIAVDGNGLARCMGGEVVYEADIRDIQLPFTQRLSRAGVRAVVLAPLRGESRIFGVLMAARTAPDSFSSTESEFLRQLSEHAALASHQAQLHGALQQAYDDLRQTQQVIMQEERLRALGQMASGVAHDINNALSPVSLYTTTLLEAEEGLSERARRYLETIRQAVDDVAETVARMREFYRKSDERLATKPIHLNQVVKQVIELTRARWNDMAQRQGVWIDAVATLDPGDPRCLGVESEIREALTNLIFNGVDAMPEGGQLVVRTQRRAGPDGQTLAVVQVRDHGVGMSPAVRERCLEPFFTTKGERGTGMGLAMVFGTMQRHGGQVEIESEEGAGTTVSLVFPPYIESQARADGPDGERDRPRRLRLLLVDDDPILLRSLQETLESDGHATTIANGGAEGIATFQNAVQEGRRFDVVITDLGMPQVDGRKVAAAIKAMDATTPVVLLTGWGQRLVADGDVPPGVDRLVAKPPKLPALRRALAEVVHAEKAAEAS